MTHRESSSTVVRVGLLLTIALSFAVPALAEWKEKVLYSFQGVPDGSVPVGGVVFDKAGNLYGATQDGGSTSCRSIYDCGTVYQLTPPAEKGGAWTETVLYVFQGNAKSDGASPFGGLVMDSSGNLYGTTAYGGTGNCVLLGSKLGCGAVFELSPPAQKGGAWTETILYSFPTSKQGYVPNGSLVFDGAGNLYGATTYGGTKGTTCDIFYGGQCGVVFELSPPKQKGQKWTEKTLYAFAGVKAGHNFGDGASPNGGLVLDSKGAIYGTTYYGGNNVKGQCQGGTSGTGCGIVFKLAPPSQKGGKWAEKVLHQFDGKDGENSAAGPVFDKGGRLYSTAFAGGGGNFPSGSAVELIPQPRRWTAHVLHSFQDNGDGGEPRSTLVFDSKDNPYGTASAGGTAGGGTVFQLRRTRHSWTLTVLYDFKGAPDGSGPSGNLIFDRTGSLYGTTQYSGSGKGCGNYGCGTVFSAEP